MTSPNPMALEAKALDPAHEIQLRIARAIFDPGATEGQKGDRTLSQWQTDAVMRVINLAALPSPTAAEGLEPVAWRWRWSKLGNNAAWHLSTEKADVFAEEGYEVEPLYAATPAARAAVLPEPQLTDLDRQSIDELRECATGPLDTRLSWDAAIIILDLIETYVASSPALKEKT